MATLIQKISEVSAGSVVIPDAVWNCKELSPTDVKLYKILLDYGKLIYELEHGKKTKDGFPVIDVSQDTLAEKVGVSTRTIQTCLERLRFVRLIRIDNHRGFKRNNHIILIGDFFGITAEELQPKGKLVVVKKEVKRVPIKRVPIKVDKPITSLEEKLRGLGGVTYTEKAIIAISRHYNMLVSRFNHISGYNSLSKNDPKKHKNWKFFEKLFHLCRDNGWDANLYLGAQFDRARKYWKNNKIKYPLPNMICSEKAVEYFERYYKDQQEKYVNEGKVKGKETKSLTQKIIQDIVRSAEFLAMYISDGDDVERSQDKAVRLFHSWESYSPAYLWTVPWFREFLNELEVNNPSNKIKEYQEEFRMFDRSKKLQEVIIRTVEASSKAFNLPADIAL